MDEQKLEQEVLQRGQEYMELKACTGYSRLLKRLEEYGDTALNDLRLTESTDPIVLKARQLIWRERESLLQMLVNEVEGGIDDRQQLIREMAEHQGLPGQRIEDYLEREEVLYGRK